MDRPWLKWSWHYGELQVDEFESRDDALLDAWTAGDAGAESLECIEAPGGTLVPGDEVMAYFIAKSDEAWERAEQQPTNTHRVLLESPNSKGRGVVGWYPSAEAAEAKAAAMRQLYGDRVRVERISHDRRTV
jgi:hypothetical protein